MEPRAGASVLPYGFGKAKSCQAKQTIDNRLAGRAAKGAVPPSAPKTRITDLVILVF